MKLPAGRPGVLLCQEIPVDLQIVVLKHIEDYALDAGFFLQEFLYCPNGDLCREIRREAENTGGDTAESNGTQIMPCC